ncbi:MAG: AmmeMemoRadiSam system protein B [Planctomycetota bacterium]|jgi:AmmeMemoRadiSam system protein B/AmmeMemoRadiSam system protein A
MDEQIGKSRNLRFLLGTVIVLFALGGAVLWKARGPKNSVAAEQTDAPKKETSQMKGKSVLRSILSDRGWYSADPETLRKQLDGFFQAADIEPRDNVIALILPHAGYRFSGQTAALALKATNKQYKRVVVIGPGHGARMEDMLSVPRVTNYETPLGQVALDVELIDKLLRFPLFQNVPYAHTNEHSVQIEVPLLQYRQKDFKLVPIVAGRCSPATVKEAGEILKSMIDSETLVVASSDFVHYGRRFDYLPFTEDVPAQIKKVDMGAYQYIEKLDAEGLLKYKQRTGATICGCIPVAILLSMVETPTRAELIKYTTSGDLTGDFNNSVSYLSAAFCGSWQKPSEIEPSEGDAKLTEEDKRGLLALARRTIDFAFQKQRVPEASDLGFAVTKAVSCPRAAFVTLKKPAPSGQKKHDPNSPKPAEVEYALRGCIGDIFPQRPLYKSVIYNAINAAFNDRRFPQLTKPECSEIKIEISALTAPKPVDSWRQIRVGTDGVVLRKNGKSAVFLPQVATEQGWDLDQMLTRLSMKAGLSSDAWKEGAGFLVFQAVVFGEDR